MNDQIDGCSEMRRGVYRKDTVLDLYATKNPLRYGIFDVKSHDLLPHRLAPGFNF